MSIQRYVAFVALALLSSFVQVQSFQFAFVSDTHIGNPTAQEDLERTIADINANGNLEFVMVKSGKISDSLMNPVKPPGKNRVVVSTMDGKIACLEYRPH